MTPITTVLLSRGEPLLLVPISAPPSDKKSCYRVGNLRKGRYAEGVGEEDKQCYVTTEEGGFEKAKIVYRALIRTSSWGQNSAE